MVDDSLNRTGASLLIDALQKNGINNLYGVVGIPITDLARLAELRGMKYYGFRREDSAVDAAAAAGFLTKKTWCSNDCIRTRFFEWINCFSTSY